MARRKNKGDRDPADPPSVTAGDRSPPLAGDNVEAPAPEPSPSTAADRPVVVDEEIAALEKAIARLTRALASTEDDAKVASLVSERAAMRKELEELRQRRR